MAKKTAAVVKEFPRADLAQSAKNMERWDLFAQYVEETSGLTVDPLQMRAAVMLYPRYQSSDVNKEFNEERKAAKAEREAARAAAKAEREAAKTERETAREAKAAERAAAKAEREATREAKAAAKKAAPKKTTAKESVKKDATVTPLRGAAKKAATAGGRKPARRGGKASQPF